MDNIGKITGGISPHTNITGPSRSFKSASSGASINTADSFQPSQNTSPGIITGTAPIGNKKSSLKKGAIKADKAQLFQLSDDEKHTRTIKIPCDKPDSIKTIRNKKGEEHCVFTSKDGHTINLIKPNGSQLSQLELPGKEKVGQLEFSGKDGTLYVRTGNAVHTVNPFSGQLKDSLLFGDFGYDKRIAIDKNGDLLLSENGELKVLDSNLNEKSKETIGFRPDDLKLLPDGALMAFDDGSPANMMLKDPTGKTVVDEKNLKLHSAVTTADGKVFAVNEKVGSKGKTDGREVIRYESATGEVTRFPVTGKVDSVIPLKDGGFITYDDSKTTKPKLVGYDRNGDAKWNISLKRKGFLRQTFLTKDEKQMYLVLCGYPNDSNREGISHLYRVNLEDGGSFFGKALGSISSDGTSLEAKELFQSKGDNDAMLPMVLDDGRIAVFEKDGIHLLSPMGKEEKSFNNIDDLKKALPDKAEVVSRRVYTDYTAEKPLEADKNKVMRHARDSYSKKNPQLYSTSIPETGLNDYGYSSSDSTINFSDKIDEKAVLDTLGAKDSSEMSKLLEGNTLLNFALTESIDVPFPQNSKIDRTVVEKNKITVKYEQSTGEKDYSFYLREPIIYSSVLPVKSGNHNYLFAGSTDGKLHWYDLDSKEEKQSYDLGAPVKDIRVADGNKIVAMTNNKGVFCLEPVIKEGEKLEGEIRLTDMNTSAITGEVNQESGKVTIDKDSRVVNIGGVQLPIKGSKYFSITQ